jgi:uncharacterized protein YoxC
MDDCPNRNRLIKELHEAVQDFSKSVSRLRVSHRDAGKFADQYQATEIARLRVEDAHMKLEQHRKEHGC